MTKSLMGWDKKFCSASEMRMNEVQSMQKRKKHQKDWWCWWNECIRKSEVNWCDEQEESTSSRRAGLCLILARHKSLTDQAGVTDRGGRGRLQKRLPPDAWTTNVRPRKGVYLRWVSIKRSDGSREALAPSRIGMPAVSSDFFVSTVPDKDGLGYVRRGEPILRHRPDAR
jgi:hypothetical protein